MFLNCQIMHYSVRTRELGDPDVIITRNPPWQVGNDDNVLNQLVWWSRSSKEREVSILIGLGLLGLLFSFTIYRDQRCREKGTWAQMVFCNLLQFLNYPLLVQTTGKYEGFQVITREHLRMAMFSKLNLTARDNGWGAFWGFINIETVFDGCDLFLSNIKLWPWSISSRK